MDDAQRLLISLEARLDKYEKEMRRAGKLTDDGFRKMERRAKRSADRMNATMAGAFKGIGTRALAFVGGAAAIRDAQKLIDSATGIRNALKVAGLEGDKLKTVYDALFTSAQKNATPLEALVTLYGRASQSAADLGASQADLLSFTDKIALALRVSGQSASESAGALLQLSQALGNGVVQAEEYNSLLDGGRTILQAVAAGLKEAGGSVSALTRLVKSGKVSSEAFFRAFLAGAPVLEEKVAGAEQTVSQHMVRLQNVLIDAAGRFNDSSEASRVLGGAIDDLAGFIEKVDFDKLVSGLGDFIAKVDTGIERIQNLASAIGHLTGLENIGAMIMDHRPDGILGGYSTKAVQDRIDAAFADGDSSAGDGRLTPDAIRQSVSGGGRPTPTVITVQPKPAPVKPVSLSDYRLPPKAGSGGGTGGSSSQNDLAREIAQIQERTTALDAMTKAQAGINPLLDDYGFAVAKATAEQDLLNAAQKAGVAITPELRANIEQLAGSYASAEASANKLADSQDDARRRMDDMRSLGRDVLGGFIGDLRSGTSAADALANAVGKIEDKLLDMALNAAFSGNGGGLFGSIFGGLFGGGQAALAASGAIFGLFDEGGFTGAGGKHQPAGVVHKGEYVVSADAVRRIGVDNLETLHTSALRGYSAGGLVGAASIPRTLRAVNDNGGGNAR